MDKRICHWLTALQETLYLRRKYRTFIVSLPDKTEDVLKFDEYAEVADCNGTHRAFFLLSMFGRKTFLMRHV
jgi:hypothetical protein